MNDGRGRVDKKNLWLDRYMPGDTIAVYFPSEGNIRKRLAVVMPLNRKKKPPKGHIPVLIDGSEHNIPADDVIGIIYKKHFGGRY